jgi:hypothetical protein
VSEPELQWVTSSFCSDGACIEAAPLADTVMVRDSKAGNGLFVLVSQIEWHCFLDAIQRGEFEF